MKTFPTRVVPCLSAVFLTGLVSSLLTEGEAFAADRKAKPYVANTKTLVQSSSIKRTAMAAAPASAPMNEVDLGWKAIADWKTDDALSHFKKASMQPGQETNYRIAWGFGAAYGQLSNFSESIRWFEKATGQYASNSRLLSDFGFTYMSMGVLQARTAKTKQDEKDAARNFDEAERKFMAALKLSPRESLPYSRLSMLSYYRGDLAQAWKYAKLSRHLGGEELDPRYLKDLSQHMPEPK